MPPCRDAAPQDEEEDDEGGCGVGCILAIVGILVAIVLAAVGSVVICARKDSAGATGGNVKSFGQSFSNPTFSHSDANDGELYDTAAAAVSAAGRGQPAGGTDADGYTVPVNGESREDEYAAMDTGTPA